jgi:non-ribosomal peptide synthetase component F
MAADRSGSVRDTGKETLEALIQRRLRAAASRRTIGAADRGRPLPLSAGQQQMWLLHQFDPASPAYLMTWVLRLSGRLDTEGLRWAWERVVERHEILRTRYASGGDEPVQIIDPPGRFALRVIDLTGEPAGRREERARQIAEWERRKPFDLTEQQPVRVTLIAIDPELHLVVVNIHHIACDGESYPRIASELSAFYAEHAGGRPAGLPEVDVQYADFAWWELAGKDNGALRPHLDYWRDALSDVTELPLPLDRPRPARPDPRGGTVDIAIKPETAEGIHALASAHRASPYMVMLAAYHAVLSHISGSAEVTVGIPVSARTVPELDQLVGYLVNTVVVRSHQVEEHTFADLLSQVRERVLDAMDHRAAPFKWVVDEVNPVRTAGASPLFQAGFDMDHVEENGGFRFPGLRTEQWGLTDTPAAKFDLTLHVEESFDKRLVARLDYAAAVIDEETAQEWASYCEALLEAVIREPLKPLVRIREQNRVPSRVGPGGDAGHGAAPTREPKAVGAAGRDRLLARIHRIWCEVLDFDGIDVRDNFFDVGGDSLRAVALAGRLREDGLDVSAADIFAYQTIEELSEACAKQLGGVAQHTAIAPFALLSQEDRAAMPPGVVDAYPLAAMQLGMIIELRARPDVNTYQDTTSYLIRDEGTFDAAALQQAAQLVVDRHEVLRTTFNLNDYSVPLQLVHREAAITVGVTNCGVLGTDGWSPRLAEHAARERRSLMDLGSAPLIRVHAHTADDAAEWWITITECHPILEGWSFHTMLMEILTGYREIRAGNAPAEPEPVPFRYADYIAAEAAARRSEEDRAYWRGVVEGRADVVLPSTWQDGKEVRRDRYQHMVDFRDLEADLRRLATETRTSIKAVLLAAHLKVMSLVSGSQDFFTGLVCDARPEVVGADRVLGMYLNTLPFAMPVGARTWGELVRAVYDGLTDMWPHRVFPMQVIQQEFGPGGRLLDVFFNYLDFHQVDGDLVDGDRTLNDNDNEFALHVFTIVGILKLNTTNHRLSRKAAVRLAAIYRTVLEQMSLGPDGDADSACLPPAERDRTRSLGRVRESGHTPATVLEPFARTVRDHPGDPAVRCGGQSLTYGQLDSWARAIAQRLRQYGVGPGSLVAVAPERDPGTPAALLGVWLAGAAWTPVEPAGHLREPGRYSAVVAATPAGIAGVDLGDLPVLVARAERLSGPAGEPAVDRRPADVACVMPTGAVFSHRALAHALDSMRDGLEALGAGPARGSSWLCAAPSTSGAWLNELLAPLTSGGVAVITISALPDAIPEVKDLVAMGAVTHLQSTPLVAERVLAAGVTAIVGGDPLANPARSGALGRRIASVEADALPGWVAFDGQPLRGLGARVVDADLRPVAIAGVVGELCVSGPGLADGFHADPAKTAERFVPDPVGGGGSRLFRTGLLARYADDGTLEQVGPIGQRTRLDGHPVELYRTRELLDAHPSVVDSCVLLRPDPSGAKHRLVGYVRTLPGAPFDEDEVRRSLAERRLPRQLIPDVLMRVDSWPLTGRGTIDADRLPESPEAAGEPAAEEWRWDDQFEALLREALASVSYDGELTPDVPLADFGLGSFATVGLLLALEQSYGITIPDDFRIGDMFRTPRTLWAAVADLMR